jgi:hypothetical protein
MIFSTQRSVREMQAHYITDDSGMSVQQLARWYFGLLA